MKLELDPLDLRPEFQQGKEGNIVDQGIYTRDVTFDKLTEEAQIAVHAVGKAVFYAWDRQARVAIFACEDEIKIDPYDGREPGS